VLDSVSALFETNGIAKLNGYETVTQTRCPGASVPPAAQSTLGSVELLHDACTHNPAEEHPEAVDDETSTIGTIDET
jgi:hypothetical protein